MTTFPPARSADEEPLYNIGAVSRMTGIPAATLRAWERRYGFPESMRTAGGHRMFSEGDVLRLRWVKARLDSGLRVSRAVLALRHHEEQGGAVRVEGHVSPVFEAPAESASLDATRERLMACLLRDDLEGADEVLNDALAVAPPEAIILRVITPALSGLGDAWEHGQIDVGEEHLSTNYLRQRLLLWMLTAPPPRAGRPIVLACAPDELHEGSLLILGALLRRGLRPVAYLGQAVPLPDLAHFVEEFKPRLVVLVAMRGETAEALVEWPRWLPDAEASGRPVIGYGGRVFTEEPDWREKVPGVFLGNTLEEGLEAIECLVP